MSDHSTSAAGQRRERSSAVLAETDREKLVGLQRLLMPASLPTIGCTEAAAAYRAHNDQFRLGGDWFDLIDRPESSTVAAMVGDVVGHGVTQIGVMGQLRAAASALAHSIEDPGDIVAGLDKFARGLPGAAFTTMAVVVLDGTSTARLCSAGHPPPLRVSADGSLDRIDPEESKGPPLGAGRSATGGRFSLEIDDVLILYTDGVVERRGLDIYDQIEALAEFVAARRLESCSEIVRAIVDDFCEGTEDDQAVLALRPLHQLGPGMRRPAGKATAVHWSPH